MTIAANSVIKSVLVISSETIDAARHLGCLIRATINNGIKTIHNRKLAKILRPKIIANASGSSPCESKFKMQMNNERIGNTTAIEVSMREVNGRTGTLVGELTFVSDTRFAWECTCGVSNLVRSEFVWCRTVNGN